jgi:hypothetical protein
MTKIMRVRLVLTGAYAGKTIELNNRTFKNGVLEVAGSGEEVARVANYFARSYQAYPEGSDALKNAQARDAEAAEAAETEEDTEDGNDQVLPGAGADEGAASSNQSGTSEQTDGSGDAGGEAAAARGGASEKATAPEGGVAGLPDDPVSVRVQAALKKLDPSEDGHWTKAGQPRIEVVAEALGDQSLTREVINAAWPNFDRDSLDEF